MDRKLTQSVARWKKAIFEISSDHEFNGLALEIFHFQHQHNPVYRAFVSELRVDPDRVTHYNDIPFLPAVFFRDHKVICGDPDDCDEVFTSSGTTASLPARHYISDSGLYKESFTRGFSFFYGPTGQYDFFALLPGYLERPNSSLVYMTDHLMRSSASKRSRFYLDDPVLLAQDLDEAYRKGKKVILFGVSYALIDFAAAFGRKIPRAIIMETGGMKGRRKEMVREELHQILCRSFGVEQIHSEYGMTELLSQAYSKGGGYFHTPPWMRILIRDVNDPLSLVDHGITGGINVIDLANMLSCPFISTQDLGKSHPDDSFEVLGRFDDSDIRGCNLMVS